jgi:hypothetical protein
MEDMIEGLIIDVGLTRAQAEKVARFMEDNLVKLPEWLGHFDLAKDIAAKIPGIDGYTGW